MAAAGSIRGDSGVTQTRVVRSGSGQGWGSCREGHDGDSGGRTRAGTIRSWRWAPTGRWTILPLVRFVARVVRGAALVTHSTPRRGLQSLDMGPAKAAQANIRDLTPNPPYHVSVPFVRLFAGYIDVTYGHPPSFLSLDQSIRVIVK